MQSERNPFNRNSSGDIVVPATVRELKGNDRAIMIVLLDHTEDMGTDFVCTTMQSVIQEETGIKSDNTVRKYLKNLEQLNFITIVVGEGRGRTKGREGNKYIINVAKIYPNYGNNSEDVLQTANFKGDNYNNKNINNSSYSPQILRSVNTKQKSLFEVPLLEPVTYPNKVEAVRAGVGTWADIPFSDWAIYYIAKHEEILGRKHNALSRFVQDDYELHISNFLEVFACKVPIEKWADCIDLLLQEYSTNVRVKHGKPRYRDNLTLFALGDEKHRHMSIVETMVWEKVLKALEPPAPPKVMGVMLADSIDMSNFEPGYTDENGTAYF